MLIGAKEKHQFLRTSCLVWNFQLSWIFWNFKKRKHSCNIGWFKPPCTWITPPLQGERGFIGKMISITRGPFYSRHYCFSNCFSNVRTPSWKVTFYSSKMLTCSENKETWKFCFWRSRRRMETKPLLCGDTCLYSPGVWSPFPGKVPGRIIWRKR